uniref:medium-chain acyl-CoA ligase n=1 Tax=Ornithorhynchus anatinus TaxID=9258 RepID=A0A6I8P9R0_ORNAN
MRLLLAGRRLLKALRTSRCSFRSFRLRCAGLAPQKIFSAFEAMSLGQREVPEYFNFAHDVLDVWCQIEKNGKRPPNPAFWWINGQGEEVKWSFEELGALSRKAANVLTEASGLERGDRMLVVLPRIPEWWLVNVACMRTGVVIIPGTSQLTARDIAYRLQASQAKAIVTSDSLAAQVDIVSAKCPSLKTKLLVSDDSRPGWLNFRELVTVASTEHKHVKTKSQDLAAIYFTSGSTGVPKMVAHCQQSFGLGFAASGRLWVDLSPSDIFWSMSDPGWVKAAWTNVFCPWIHGSCVFVHQMPQFDSKLVLNTLSSFPITTFCMTSTGFRLLIQQDLASYQFKSLRHCVTGGEPLNPEVRKQWKSQTGLELYEGYGQTETVLVCSNNKAMKIKSGSMGKATPPYDVQIVDENGEILPPGEEGDIAIRIKPTRPFCFFSGYLDNPEKTKSTQRGNFYVTGDRGRMDEEGYFWFLGRADDVINSAGYRIGPFEVESALMEHPAVVESAVVSSPDPIRGEVVKAFVVLKDDFASHDPERLTLELQRHVQTVTAPYKYPRKVEFVTELPKTITGKIQRNILRKQEWGQA